VVKKHEGEGEKRLILVQKKIRVPPFKKAKRIWGTKKGQSQGKRNHGKGVGHSGSREKTKGSSSPLAAEKKKKHRKKKNQKPRVNEKLARQHSKGKNGRKINDIMFHPHSPALGRKKVGGGEVDIMSRSPKKKKEGVEKGSMDGRMRRNRREITSTRADQTL